MLGDPAVITLARDGTCPLRNATARLATALATLSQPDVGARSEDHVCITRVEVEVDGVSEVAHWLCHQQVYPRIYFSDQHKLLRVAGVGAAQILRAQGPMDDGMLAQVFDSLSNACDRMRFYGGMRFDPDSTQHEEWQQFGGSVFVLPLWELQICADGRCFMACHLRWSCSPSEEVISWHGAMRNAMQMLQELCPTSEPVPPPQMGLPTLIAHEGSLDAQAWDEGVRTVLEGIEAGEWSKVVLAQRVGLHFNGAIEPMHILLRLLEADDAGIASGDNTGSSQISGARHAYLFLLQLSSDVAFMGCTPEKLFKIEGDQLTTEALAGTRARGDTPESDSQLAHELIQNEKEIREVNAVRDFLLRALEPAYSQLEHAPPFVLQLRHVQHICMPISAKLTSARGEKPHQHVQSALDLLHPTPAVCGSPSSAARSTIRKLERFDRGFYAGPLGYIGSGGCEFCVAIRSALINRTKASIFAGAGIVRGSTAVSEWEEVHVKMKNFVSLFPCADRLVPAPTAPFLALPNLNALCASLLVEELLRSGLGHVVLAPGSRCAPLTVAVARTGCPHSLANDERGAAFMALGFARASGRCAAVVVSSGTAVANLLPAVVEASQDNVPLLLISADRPPELRDTAANQTINQVGILDHRLLRWFKDFPCPTPQMPLEALLSDASYAFARACGPRAGPVHMNIMLREPLDPRTEPWPHEMLQGSHRLSRWMASRQPYTNHLAPYRGLSLQPDAQLLPILESFRTARRGLIVAGALSTDAQRRALAALAGRLGWPIVADVCSGLRKKALADSDHLAPLCDLLLAADSGLHKVCSPDVVIQAGGRLVSKRVQALVAAASSIHVFLAEHEERMDPCHSVTHRLQGDMAQILGSMLFGLEGGHLPSNPLLRLCAASANADAVLQSGLLPDAPPLHLDSDIPVGEPWVARHICAVLRASACADDELLFASNSLPIRHLDTYCPQVPTLLSNRGASGIDGILHTALGAALGGATRTTLLVGDLATLHDLNAFATIRKASPPLIIVVLNNEGGGIFRYLPIASHSDVYSPYFDTPHTHSFEACCRGFNLPYAVTGTRRAFATAFERARQEGGPHVIEVQTDKEVGYAEAMQLRESVREAARKAVQELNQIPGSDV